MSTSSEEVKATDRKVDSEHFLTEEEDSPVGCGILGRNPVLGVMGFAAVGIGLGIGLSYWEPDDMETKDKLLKWIGLLGDLFIRSLKCVVLPLVSYHSLESSNRFGVVPCQSDSHTILIVFVLPGLCERYFVRQ